MTRARKRARTVAGAFGMIAAALGCQVIVSGDAPTVACASADPSACPSGLVCDLALRRCVGEAGAIIEDDGGPFDPDAEVPSDDARADQDAGPSALGVPCRVDSDCRSKLCGTSAMLTTAITAGTGPVCTQTCCTSSDCAAGFLCFGAGTGGNYCVAAATVQRPPVDARGKVAGAGCSNNSECRSGQCVSQKCLDTCCSNANCTNGTRCRLERVALAPPGHDAWVCSDPGGATKDPAQMCVDNAECKSFACVPTGNGSCRSPCCGKAACAGSGVTNARCVYGPSNSDVYKLCFGGSGTVPVGTACQTDLECVTNYCDAELKTCADTCCVDGDCPAGQACRPAAVQTPYLRCVAK